MAGFKCRPWLLMDWSSWLRCCSHPRSRPVRAFNRHGNPSLSLSSPFQPPTTPINSGNCRYYRSAVSHSCICDIDFMMILNRSINKELILCCFRYIVCFCTILQTKISPLKSDQNCCVSKQHIAVFHFLLIRINRVKQWFNCPFIKSAIYSDYRNRKTVHSYYLNWRNCTAQ